MAILDLKARLDLAVAVAQEAGQITLGYFGHDNFQVESKADQSPVTVADREAEQHLRKRIAAAFPGDGILGEEFPEQPGDTGYRWILDPIDGTQSFIRAVPLYGTLIGLEHETRSVLGVILVPVLDECVYAAVGHGAWYRRGGAAPVRASVSTKGTLAEGTFLTSDVGSFGKTGRGQVYDRLAAAARVSRTWGDCFGYLMVATGRAELMVDPIMNVWDAAALQPILEEAGGTYTDWQGRPTIHGGEGIATNGRVLDEVLAITRS